MLLPSSTQLHTETDLKEGQAAQVAQVVAAALCQQEVVVHGSQALPGHQLEVVFRLCAQAQLQHHGRVERRVLLCIAPRPVLLRKAGRSHQEPWQG